MPAQLIFVAAVIVMTLILWRSRETASGRAWKRILLVLFAGFAIWTVLFPETATEIANALGIGRGTDLIVYITAFALMFLSLLVYLKFRRLDERLAVLTQELALAEWDRTIRAKQSDAPDAAEA